MTSERPVSSLARVGAQFTAQAPGPVRALPTAKLVARSCQLSYQPFLKIVCEAVTCGNGAPGGIRTPNLLIQSQMLPESYHLFEASRDLGVSERRSASGRAEARARSSIVSQVFSTYLITVQPHRDDYSAQLGRLRSTRLRA